MNETISFGGRPVVGFGLGIANPASENCIAKGGKLEPYTTARGDQGSNCILPDGTRCEEWALFRGECTGKPPEKHLSPLLTFPAGGAVIGGLIGYAVKRNAGGAAVGALVGAASPFALAAVLWAAGWSP